MDVTTVQKEIVIQETILEILTEEMIEETTEEMTKDTNHQETITETVIAADEVKELIAELQTEVTVLHLHQAVAEKRAVVVEEEKEKRTEVQIDLKTTMIEIPKDLQHVSGNYIINSFFMGFLQIEILCFCIFNDSNNNGKCRKRETWWDVAPIGFETGTAEVQNQLPSNLMNPHQTRQAKRIYVGNIPVGISEVNRPFFSVGY